MVEHKEDPFNPEIILKLCSDVCENLVDLPIEPFCKAMNEYTKLLKLLGSAMSLAFSDITSKTAALMGHLQTYKGQIKGLMTLIQLEIRIGVQNLSGENNKKLTKNKNLWKYESGARTALRLLWFMDFLTVMFRELIQNPQFSYPKVVKIAYNEALGPHHELIYRLAAQAGFLVAPGREVFYTNFCGNFFILKKERGFKK